MVSPGRHGRPGNVRGSHVPWDPEGRWPPGSGTLLVTKSPLLAGSWFLVSFLPLARHPLLTAVEMNPGPRVRGPGFPTTYVTGAV